MSPWARFRTDFAASRLAMAGLILLMLILVAAVIAPWGLGEFASVATYAEAALITALLFPIVRPLYMSATPSMRAQSGARR